MTIHDEALALAMKAKAGVLDAADALALVVLATRACDGSDPMWRSIRDFGRVVCAEGVDPFELAAAGDQMLSDLGAAEVFGV